MAIIRRAAVAGSFYPTDPRQLEAVVMSYLAGAETAAGKPPPKAVIAPHAGYVYSGPVAASVYARLLPARGRIERVVLVGPSHRVPFRGLAVSTAEAYATPLGEIPVDRAAVGAIAALPGVTQLDAAHLQEHSIEVQLPFLQKVLGGFALVPIIAGEASAETVAAVLEALWGGPETLIVVSSDLSHYLDYEAARRADDATARAIESLDDAAIGYDQACGQVPIRGLLALARRRGLAVEQVDLRNSGDTAGPRHQVVGYGAWAFHPSGRGATAADAEAEEAAAVRRHDAVLLDLADRSIRSGLASGRPLAVETAELPAPLRRPAAAFVTLRRRGELRGCIGTAEARQPLAAEVAQSAFQAAFRDPRFPALGKDELADLGIGISVLTAPQPLDFADETALLRLLRPRRDGLIIQDRGRRALFLPAGWDSVADAADFLAHLKRKAGLRPLEVSATLQAWRFGAIELGV